MVDVDVADWDRVSSATARTIAEMGGVDILINNAGIAGANATVVDMDPAEWRRVVEIDLNGVFHCCKAVVPHMIEGGMGASSIRPQSRARRATRTPRTTRRRRRA